MSGKLGIFDGFVMLKLIHRLDCAVFFILFDPYYMRLIKFLQY